MCWGSPSYTLWNCVCLFKTGTDGLVLPSDQTGSGCLFKTVLVGLFLVKVDPCPPRGLGAAAVPVWGFVPSSLVFTISVQEVNCLVIEPFLAAPCRFLGLVWGSLVICLLNL